MYFQAMYMYFPFFQDVKNFLNLDFCSYYVCGICKFDTYTFYYLIKVAGKITVHFQTKYMIWEYCNSVPSRAEWPTHQ